MKKPKKIYQQCLLVSDTCKMELKQVCELEDCSEPARLLFQCLEEMDSAKQSAALKKAGNLLQGTSHSSGPPPEWYRKCLNVLAEVFLASDKKNPSRKTVSSIFDSLLQSCGELVHNIVSHAAFNRMAWSKDLILQGKDVSLRSDVDMVSAMLDNFSLGTDVILGNGKFALEFLGICLNRQRKAASIKSLPTLQTSLMLDCLMTIKTIISLLQKCSTEQILCEEPDRQVEHDSEIKNSCSQSPINRAYLYGQDDPKPWKWVMKEILDDLSFVLFDEMFLADCRSAAGMTIPLLIKLMCPDEYIVSTMTKVLFCCHVKIEASIVSTPDELKEFCGFQGSQGVLNFSHLCLCHGVLAMVPPQVLIQPSEVIVDAEGKNGTLLFDVLFPDLCNLCDSLKEASECLAASRTLALWASQARQIASSNVVEAPWICPKLSGTSPIAQKLLGFVWTHWDHPIEGVRYQTRTICEDVVQMHQAVTQSDSSREMFLKELTMSLVKVGWYVRGKYGPLCCITPVVGAKRMLAWHPRIPQDIFTVMKDRGLVPHIMEFVGKIASCHKEEILAAEEDINEWVKVWIVPVLHFLHHGCRQLREHLTQYCLPKLLKCCPESLQFLVEHLQVTSESKSRDLGALVTCLKVARSLGLLKVQQKCAMEPREKQCLWCGVVPVNLMKKALCHLDDQIRLDALALLCDSPRTTESVNEVDLELLQYFVPPNMKSQSSSFRQQVGARLKKFLLRLKECIRIANKKVTEQRTQPDCENQLQQKQLSLYKEFLAWFCGVQFDSLFPGASFARRTTALCNLMLIKQIFSTDESNDSNKLAFAFDDVMTRDRVYLLLDCFHDTYDVNKTMAFDVLVSRPSNMLPFQDEKSLAAWLQLADRLVSSPRAIDSSSAAVLLRLLIEQSSLTLTFSSLMTGQREEAGSTLPSKCTLIDESHVPCIQAFRVLSYLIDLLRLQRVIAIKNLPQAAVNAPMHGVLYCLRAILGHLSYRNVASDNRWQKLVSVLLTECFETADIVAPVVTSPSPEGHVMEDNEEAEEDWVQGCVVEGGEVMAPAAQILLVCCWRTMKEVALLLGELAENAPGRFGQSESGLLTADMLLRIGEFFTKILLTSKHRGAFELAYTGFVKLCSVLWRSPDCNLRQLPEQWLESLLQDVQSAVPSDVLCGTRRSAGLPFFVQAIVTTEPFSAGKACFKRVMKELLEMASESVQETRIRDSTLPQVHARNILRSLYRDTKLGEDVFPFVSHGVVTAVQGFQSESWAVRNSSTLLFSALVTRIFGVKRSKDEHSRRNCMTGREFFSRFPELHSFLLSQLQVACEAIESENNIHPSLYPVLVLLSRLYPSSMDGVDSALNMTPFLPNVISCRKSSVMKTRAMSARAIVPLVSGDSLVEILQQFVVCLPSSNSEAQKQNQIHGALLQVQNLLQSHVCDVTVSYPIKKQIVTDILPQLKRSAWLGTRSNPCALTRSVFLDIVVKYVVDWSWLGFPVSDTSDLIVLAQRHLQPLKEYFVNMAIGETLTTLKQDHCVVIGEAFVKQSVAKICLAACEKWTVFSGKHSLSAQSSAHSLDAIQPHSEAEDPAMPGDCYHPLTDVTCFELICALLQSTEYEVRFAVLDFLVIHLSSSEDKYDLVCQEQVGIDTATSDRLGLKLRSELFSMAMETERHTECVVKVYEVLYRLPGVLSFPWTLCSGEQISIFQCWKFVVDLITKPCQRNTLKCALLAFLSLMVPVMYGMTNNTDSTVAVRALQTLDDLSAITRDTSSPSESVEVRLSTAQLLGQSTVSHVMMDTHSMLGDLPLQLWSVVINLLHDDGVIVRERMAQGFSDLIRDLKDVTHDALLFESSSVVAPLSMEHAMLCAWDLFVDRQPVACVQWMLGWICGDLSCAAHGDDMCDMDRLFEKGSLNIYAEKCEVTSLAFKMFKRGLKKDAAVLTLQGDSWGVLWKILEKMSGECLLFLEGFLSRNTTMNGNVFACVYQSLVGLLVISSLKEKVNAAREGSDTATRDGCLTGELTCCASLRTRMSVIVHEIKKESEAGGVLVHPRVRQCVEELYDSVLFMV